MKMNSEFVWTWKEEVMDYRNAVCPWVRRANHYTATFSRLAGD